MPVAGAMLTVYLVSGYVLAFSFDQKTAKAAASALVAGGSERILSVSSTRSSTACCGQLC